MRSMVPPQAGLRSTPLLTWRRRGTPSVGRRRPMPVTDSSAIADVADRLFEAIEQSDIAMVGQMWNEDVVVWKVADHDRDKERALRVITWFVNTTTHRRYEI